MDIIYMINKAPIHDDSKEILRLRYIDKKVERNEMEATRLATLTERTFYRRKREALDWIESITIEEWKQEDEIEE